MWAVVVGGSQSFPTGVVMVAAGEQAARAWRLGSHGGLHVG